MQLAADDAPHVVLRFGVGRNGGRSPWLPLHGEGGQGVASSSVFGVHGPGMVVTEVNGDIALSGAGHRCVQLGFLEHRCLRGCPDVAQRAVVRWLPDSGGASSRWTGLVLKSG